MTVPVNVWGREVTRGEKVVSCVLGKDLFDLVGSFSRDV